MKDRMTILVNSCDKNTDLWDLFFKNLKQKWPDCPFDIILNTETKIYHNSEFKITCYQVAKNKTEEELKNYNWSDRLLDNLKYIKTKYTFFTLEDFYIKNEVDNKKVENLLNSLDKIKNFGCLTLVTVPNFYPAYYNKKADIFKIALFASLKVCASVNIWNTKFLKSITKRGENPWQFEIKASNRAYLKNKKFYSLNNFFAEYDKSAEGYEIRNRDVFNIDFSKQVIKGKWGKDAVEYLTNIDPNYDFSKRGITEIKKLTEEETQQVYYWYKTRFNLKNEFAYNFSYFFRKIKLLLKRKKD